jgi:hypothetical protein
MITLTILEGIGGFIAFCLVGTLVVFLLQGVSNLFNAKIVSRHGGNTIVEPTRKKKAYIPPLEKLKAYNEDLYFRLINKSTAEEEKITIILNLDRFVYSHEDTLVYINTFVDLKYYKEMHQQVPKIQMKPGPHKNKKPLENRDDDLPF